MFNVFLCIFFSPILFLALPVMTFLGCFQLYCYSKDPVMSAMNVPLNFHILMLDSLARQGVG